MDKREFSPQDKENAYRSLGIDIVARGTMLLKTKVPRHFASVAGKLRMSKTLFDEHNKRKIH